MIATATPTEQLLTFVAPLAWRSPRHIARKLAGFAATEAGSALDMWKAAELTADARLRPLFFQHALDEARHARMFRSAARRIGGDASGAASGYQAIHAVRQNLYAELGTVRFLAFVYMAERRGELQFRALARHFAAHALLGPLFLRIADDERRHVAYSRALLDSLIAEGRGKEVRQALLRCRGRRALDAWRRSGRVLGDVLGVVLLSAVYLVVLPLFALIARIVEPPARGWLARRSPAPDRAALLAQARRQF